VATHEYPADRVHYTWDAGNEAVLTIESGDTVVFETRDVTDGQIGPGSTPADIGSIDFARLYPLAGPIRMVDAEPGDSLAIEVVELTTKDWGFAAIIPGLGLLAEDFTEPYLRLFDLTDSDETRLDSAVIPIEPFFGTMGVCPAGASNQAVMPPGTFGGNVDIRHLTAGTTLYLPVQVEGALFSCGDAHAAQGDGEVCVTGIEAPMLGVLRFELHEGRSIPAPQYRTSGILTPRTNTAAGWYATTGVGPDLYRASQDAVRALIDHVTAEYGLSPEDAYVLASLVADLKISEIVDAGQYIVSALLPLSVFPV
jgi:acetamidase/formamidase